LINVNVIFVEIYCFASWYSGSSLRWSK